MMLHYNAIKLLASAEYFIPEITNGYSARMTFGDSKNFARIDDVEFPDSWFIVLRSKKLYDRTPCSNPNQKSHGYLVLSREGWEANKDMLKKECKKDKLRCKMNGNKKHYTFEYMEKEMKNVWRIVEKKKAMLKNRLQKQIKFVDDNYE